MVGESGETMRVRLASLDDVKYVISLANKESQSVGFIPKPAYEAAITGCKTGKRWSTTCNDVLYICEENEEETAPDSVGFVLASGSQKRVRIAQICIQSDARLIERGKSLLSAVIDNANQKSVFDFGCGCADDLESNRFWKAMGWQKVGERRGISGSNTWVESSDRLVNLYAYQSHGLFMQEKPCQ